MKKMIAFAAVALLALPAMAFGQSMSVGACALGGTPGPVFDVGVGAQFNVVVNLDSGTLSPAAAEFIVTELTTINGIFKLGTVKINNTPLDLGNNALGEYILAFGGCEPAGMVEMVRLTYGTFGGPIPADTVMSLRGFGPGDTQPSSFGGSLGFIDCGDAKHPVQMGGTDGGSTGTGAEFPDGGCVINGSMPVVPTENGSMGQLKARF